MSAESLGIGSQITHTEFGQGVIVEINIDTYSVYFKQRGVKDIVKTDSRVSITELKVDEVPRITLAEVEQMLNSALRKWSDATELVDLGDKWKDGVLIFKPGKEGTKAKEIPIEAFFHKIVMTRDRLRVMEQKINASKLLSDEEKVALQQYITRIYGSLTTFNVFFADKKDHFKGSS